MGWAQSGIVSGILSSVPAGRAATLAAVSDNVHPTRNVHVGTRNADIDEMPAPLPLAQ